MIDFLRRLYCRHVHCGHAGLEPDGVDLRCRDCGIVREGVLVPTEETLDMVGTYIEELVRKMFPTSRGSIVIMVVPPGEPERMHVKVVTTEESARIASMLARVVMRYGKETS